MSATTDRPKLIRAPWTDEQVAALAERQANQSLHEYTCSQRHRRPKVMRPTREGWRCPSCDHLQDWAWDPL